MKERKSESGYYMPEILGYGEDALTYWALTNELEQVLKTLNDNTDRELLTILYRPRFGRIAKSKKGSRLNKAGPGFGEFDAIISTPTTIYLIETKWTKSGEAKAGEVSLEPKQVQRHHIMKAYLDAWAEMYQGNNIEWKTFYARHKTDKKRAELVTEVQFHGPDTQGKPTVTMERLEIELPKLKNKKGRVARNLAFVLNRIGTIKKKVVDVLLCINMAYDKNPYQDARRSFTVVPLPCNCEPSGYVKLN